MPSHRSLSKCLLLSALLCLSLWQNVGYATESSTSTSSEQLVQSEDLFSSGSYAQSQKVVTRISDTHALTPPERERYFLLRARLELAFGRDAAMHQWLHELFVLAPESSLDPSQDPPIMISYWEELQRTRPVAPEKTPTAAPPPTPSPSGPPNDAWEKWSKMEPGVKEASRFWVTLVPFGIGHFEAGLYPEGAGYLGGEVVLLTYRGLNYTHGLSNIGLVGVVAHEWCGLLPVMESRNPEFARRFRYAMSFFPFGAAQRKNGQTIKSFAFGAVESVVLASALTRSPGERDDFMSLLALAMAYGAWDGWYYHESTPVSAAKAPSIQASIVPTILPLPIRQDGFAPAIQAGITKTF